jgi:dinuclear metal center YbgI/SA1388 family protein
LSHDINIIGAHTNLDSAVDGVNDVLGDALGLTNRVPLAPSENQEQAITGLGRIGTYPNPVSRKEFLTRLFYVLGVQSLNIVGELPEKITTVALCGGSGSDFTPLAHKRGADVYLSAEIKHSTAIWARETGFAVIDGSHYATEKPATFYLARNLEEIAAEKNWQLKIQLTETEEHPFVSLHISNLEDEPIT